jgi:hypothetical protein
MNHAAEGSLCISRHQCVSPSRAFSLPHFVLPPGFLCRLPVLEHVARRHDVLAPDADLFNAAAAFVKTHAHLVNAPPPKSAPSSVADHCRRTDAAGASAPPSALAAKRQHQIRAIPSNACGYAGGFQRNLSSKASYAE